MKYLVFNPDWTVPPTILAQDVLGGHAQGAEHDREEALDDSRSRRAAPSIRRRSTGRRRRPGTSATRCASRPAPTTRSGGSSSSSRTSTRSSCTTRRAASCSPPTSARSARAASASSTRSTSPPSCSQGRTTGPRRASRRSSTAKQSQTVFLDHAAAGAHRLLDRLGRRRPASCASPRTSTPRPRRPPRARGHSTVSVPGLFLARLSRRGQLTVECPRLESTCPGSRGRPSSRRAWRCGRRCGSASRDRRSISGRVERRQLGHAEVLLAEQTVDRPGGDGGQEHRPRDRPTDRPSRR